MYLKSRNPSIEIDTSRTVPGLSQKIRHKSWFTLIIFYFYYSQPSEILLLRDAKRALPAAAQFCKN